MPLRDNPLALRQWILAEYDHKKQQHPIDDEAEIETAWLGDEGEAADDPSLIQILPRQRPSESVMLLRIAPKSIQVPAVDVESRGAEIEEMRVLETQGQGRRSSSTLRQLRQFDGQL